ncbi:MAG TPA: nickel pincer cofactor biosynthesis protein LarB [Candidatus Polarisedimenticolia bacterium]|nr:nickel pincer cofactor biosynthesis protein LarB [Candidatus Polarisedimenticolia bacterium]
MQTRSLRGLLRRIHRGGISIDAALERLRALPFEDLGFAKIDTHRELRRGFPEVIFGEGKTVPQIVAIVDRIAARGQPVLVTRVGEEVHRRVRERHPGARYHAAARAVTVGVGRRRGRGRPGILVLAAGTSDLPVAEEAVLTAEVMGNRVERAYDVGIAGLHRLLAQRGKLRKARVIVAVAGMEGALPSVVAGLVAVPVIGVPTSIGYGTGLKGVAALMGMLNSCSTGLMVVNIDNGFGAGYSASIINSMSNK